MSELKLERPLEPLIPFVERTLRDLHTRHGVNTVQLRVGSNIYKELGSGIQGDKPKQEFLSLHRIRLRQGVTNVIQDDFLAPDKLQFCFTVDRGELSDE